MNYKILKAKVKWTKNFGKHSHFLVSKTGNKFMDESRISVLMGDKTLQIARGLNILKTKITFDDAQNFINECVLKGYIKYDFKEQKIVLTDNFSNRDFDKKLHNFTFII